MGTNYYRIPTEEEMEKRKSKLIEKINTLELTPSNINRNFRTLAGTQEYENINIWDEFIDDTLIHLGKRSGGWKFCWNFHNNKFYANKNALLSYIRSGRVVDEYGKEEDVEEFIKMALEWCQPDGLIANAIYMSKQNRPLYLNNPTYYDKEIDGLRVSSSVDFS